jgi:hypothetical protein
LKVAPNGDYLIGTAGNGAREFTPSGSFVRQYGTGDLRAIAIVPNNRLWAAGAGTMANVFDTLTGAQAGSFTLDQQTMGYSMQYNPVTDTVLVVDEDRDAGGVYERDLNGLLLQQFHVPIAQTNCYSATRGPAGHVFGTTNDFFADVIDWDANGAVSTTVNVYPVQITPVRILWAGTVPEPTPAITVIGGLCLTFSYRPRKDKG